MIMYKNKGTFVKKIVFSIFSIRIRDMNNLHNKTGRMPDPSC